jgi:hypothetical protein
MSQNNCPSLLLLGCIVADGDDGNDNHTWRFLKDAIDDWLRTQDSRMILLQQAGVFADDPALAEIRKTIYENRGRSEVDDE